MGWFSSIVAVAVLAATPVEVTTLDGEQHTGDLAQVTESVFSIRQAETTVEIPLQEVLEVRFPAVDRDQQSVGDSAALVTFVDETRTAAPELIVEGQKVSLQSTAVGDFEVPLARIAHIRFQTLEPKFQEAWDELCQRELRRDLLVVRKGEVLDHLDGVIGGIDERSVRFLLDGDEIPVRRDRVYGVIYARNRSADDQPICEASLLGPDRLKLKSIRWEEGQFHGTLLAGADIVLPLDRLDSLDFSLGKVRYLSQMEPREVKYTPFFDVVWKYRRDRNLDGGPIRLGNKTYARGLAIHSRTFLRYRLDGEYRRFRAVMGIDQLVGRKGDVHVVISGDGKPLLEADVRGVDEPREIDLDITGVRDLEILVDFGGDLDIADHLDLADARVIK